ncbi:superfamily I DNA/RNA helicase [Spiroplasma chinense]|uniref:Superfamily I DNA/RNA helicase n=1 Tax=Spiroplasma chinense TaxID=216932 RepID=A0A5B9Y390_9MOLU|nr:AAA domain-containing protein [Spiroplasma chinense]QEH61441.1 superfamily I DNA/RNA helicase [Spiroplasma chinense]
MGNIIENNGTKELFLDFSYLQNVMFKDNIAQLDQIVERLDIEGINTYQEFQNFLRSSMVKQCFICLIDDKTRKVGKKDTKQIYDAIVRLEMNSISQSKFPKDTYLGLFVNINPQTPYLTINSIFETRLKPSPQEFETTIKETQIQVIKYQNQMTPDEILRRSILNSSNISQLGKLVSSFEEEKTKWLNYLDFSSDLLNIQRKNSLPFLGCFIEQVIKVEKKNFNSALSNKIQSEYSSRNDVYLELSAEPILKGNGEVYEKVNIITLDVLTDNVKKVERIRKTNDLSIIPFRLNKIFPPVYNLQKNPAEIFDFEFEKVQDSSSIVPLSNLVGIKNGQESLIDYWQKAGHIIFGTQKEMLEIEKNFSKEFSEWKVLKLQYEMSLDIDLDLFKIKNNIDYLSSGYLAYVGIGEDVLIDRSRQVLKRISEGNTKNPYLINYLFNTKLIELSESANEVEISDDQFNYSLNFEQKEAVRKALNSKDIFLLQGPPGTGKTQVICEIIYQLSKLNRKVLISSQNHEAIKNVVDRLPYEPNVNRIRLTNQINAKSKSANNFSPERVVYNYYKSIAKSMYDDMMVSQNTLDEFKEIESKLEKLILSNKGYHQNNNQVREIQKQIDSINDRIKELRLSELSSIGLKNELKEELINIENLISVLKDLDFKIAISVSEKIKKVYEQEIKFELDQFVFKNSIELEDEGNIFSVLQKVAQEILFSDEVYADIQTAKVRAVEFRRNAEFDLAQQEDERIVMLEKILLKNESANELLNIFSTFSKRLDDLKVELTLNLEKSNVVDNEVELNRLEIEKNELQVTKQKLTEVVGSASGELRELIKYANSKFNLSLGVTDVDLEEQVKAELKKYSTKLEESKSKNDELKYLYENVSEYLKDSYGITNNWNEEIATKNFTNQMMQESKRYASSIINNLVNVYAMTLTSSNLFRYNKDDYAKKLGLDEINLRTMDVDVVIIDEASKATLLEILMPLVYGKTLILVGDYRQLPPILKLQPSDVDTVNELTGKNYNYQQLFELLDQSAFKTLVGAKNKSVTTMLKTQYRSHGQIMDIVNKFYDNELKVEPQVSEQKRHDLIVKTKNGSDFIGPHSSVYWIDSSNDENDQLSFEQSEEYSTSLFNDLEIKLTLETLKNIDKSLEGKTFANKPTLAVISFYGLHVNKLKKEVRRNNYKNFELIVNTVDDFQGKEADYVIVNLVRNPEKLSSRSGREFLKKYERINVAFSRARELLVIIGAQRAVNDITVQIPTVEDPNVSNTYEVYADIIAKIDFDHGFKTAKEIL